MLKHLLAIAALLAAPLAANAQTTPLSDMPSGAYQNDINHTSLTFRVNHMGMSHYTARFTKVNATLSFEAKDVTKSSVKATIDPTSIRTDFSGAEDFDGVLAKDKTWFNATQFPTITFESTRVEKTGDDTCNIVGNLTFLGITKPVTLAATFNGAYAKRPYIGGAGLGFSATTTLKRSDWGMGNGIPMVGDEVSVIIETEFGQEEKK